ncbi:hypothetical protein KDA_08320 [Dictyobacter alpinus]|uniref:WDR19 first beta-propeller domain-containing protein n=1 Tax=Dictyobacter alpinus TaxID=2014873 RepID=A0A402B1Z1_9CHLR|nr:EsaB/YukD family protein [Dictyobacter alpinus]GCE25348.1 hypothetical protein KDA_08320 [Dictyobacter alpinus]
MHKSEILIEQDTFGEARPVVVAMEVPISVVLPKLVDILQLPKHDLFGNPLVYTLRHAASGRILLTDQTLTAAGILPGMRLMLDSSSTESLSVPIAPIASETVIPGPGPGPLPLMDSALHSSETIADQSLFATIPSQSSQAPIDDSGTKKRGGISRRALLATLGTLVGVGAAGGVGYAAYHNWFQAAQTQQNAGVMPVKMPAQKPAMQGANPTLKVNLTFTKHKQLVRSIAWSPTGNTLASGSDDTQVLLWDTMGNIQRIIEHPAAIRGLAWSPDGAQLATGANNQVAFWDSATGRRLAFSTQLHNQMVTGLAWATHNMKQLVSVGSDKRAVVWNTQNFRPVRTYRAHTNPITAVSWSTDGQTVATVSDAGAVRIWNAATGKDIHGYYQDAQIPMRTLAFAVDGATLAVGGDDGVLRIWNALTCARHTAFSCVDAPQRLQLVKSSLRAVAWSSDGRFLAVGAQDGTFIVLQANKGMKQIFSQKLNGAIHGITWSPNGKQVATALGNQAIIWDVIA